MGSRVWGLGSGVWGLGSGVWGLGFGVRGVGFSVSVLGAYRHQQSTWMRQESAMRSRHFIAPPPTLPAERDFFIDNLLVRTYFIIVMIRWTGLAPWEFEFPFPGALHAFLIDD